MVSAGLPFLVCTVLALASSLYWWRTLPAPWLYLGVGFLTLLGLHQLVQAVMAVGKAVASSGSMLEAPTSASSIELVQRSQLLEAFGTSVAIVVLGLPLLVWLKRALLGQ